MAGSWSLPSWLPSVDGQTAFSIVVGLAATIITFWLAYRKTIGARDERLRAADQELCNSVIKRIAVEREPLNIEQFAALRRAKGIKAQVPASRLISFGDALSIALLETIDNNFLDTPSKNSIIDLLAKSRSTQGVDKAETEIAEQVISDKARPYQVALLIVYSTAIGGIFSVLGYISVENSTIPAFTNSETFIFTTKLIFLLLLFVWALYLFGPKIVRVFDKFVIGNIHVAKKSSKPNTL